jgi:hypothetical protein
MSVTFEVGRYVQRRPLGAGNLVFRIAGEFYVMMKYPQADMRRLVGLGMPDGYPAFWCPLGPDWIGVYPVPRHAFAVAFDGAQR